MKKVLQRPALAALVIWFISWVAVRAGIALGEAMVQPGEGFQQKYGILEDLFRFDAEYYYAIATSGYSYNGDPASSPNIVFAPLYPILIWLLSSVPGISEVTAGFLLNKLFLLLALYFLFQYFSAWLGSKRSFWLLTSMATAAGAYSFHAYYSESTMLLAISLLLWGHQRNKPAVMALAAAAAGASRLAALPVAGVTGAFLLIVAARTRQPRKKIPLLIWSLVCGLGTAVYLAYVAYNFDNPFRLLPEIQGASWGFFHPETSWLMVLSGANLFSFAWSALEKGPLTLLDIKTLNLIWTLLALASVIYSIKKFGVTFFTALFAAYFLFAYGTGAGSDFLISAHRFYVLMLPIFVMFSGVARHWTLAGLLILINLFYGLMHTAFFNQGIWFYF
jgi:hypothetical protein